MSTPSQHQLVAFGAFVGALLCIYLLITFVRSRSKKQVRIENDDLAERIQERLDTGRFSREPSTIRHKAVDTSKTAAPLTSLEEDAGGEDNRNISRQG